MYETLATHFSSKYFSFIWQSAAGIVSLSFLIRWIYKGGYSTSMVITHVYICSSLDSTQPLMVGLQRPLLILLDRNMDLATPLHHTWTYQALAHDVLVSNTNVCLVEVFITFYGLSWTGFLFNRLNEGIQGRGQNLIYISFERSKEAKHDDAITTIPRLL